jgi:hypothetical protein
MIKRLKRIAPLKAGIVLGILYTLLGLLIVPFFMLAGFGAMAAASRNGGAPIPFAFLFGAGALFVPILYGVMGFVLGVLTAAIYNLVAKWTGGIEVTVEDVV